MEQLINYVKENYKTESTTIIGEKFGVTRQKVCRIIRELNTLGLISTKDSFSSVKLQPKKEKVVKNVERKRVFKNHEGIGKQECRKMVSDLIGSIPCRCPKILTLPCDKWIWEKEILKRKSESKFVGVEYDNDVFNKMVKTYMESPELQKSVIGLHNSPMSDVIRKSVTDEYNHMILDYCGIINSFRDEIEEVLVRDLVKVGGIISITLSKSSRHNNDVDKEIRNIVDMLPQGYFNDESVDCVLSTKISIMNMVYNQKGKYKIDELFHYNDTSGMMLFIIRRMK